METTDLQAKIESTPALEIPAKRALTNLSINRTRGENYIFLFSRYIASDRVAVVITFLAIAISIVSVYVRLSQGLVLAFGDAIARLIIGKSVISGLNIGLAQLGGTWPPLPQLAMRPFIGNQFLYETGLAGVIFPMACFVIGVLTMYLLVKHFTKNKIAASAGAIAFMLNANILFMQSTPMSEVPFIAFYLLAIYFFLRWVENPEQPLFLVTTGIATGISCSIRYEGWVLALVLVAVGALVGIFNGYSPYKWLSLVKKMVYLPIVVIGLWLLYNLLIFGHPLYFSISQYAPWAIAKKALEHVNPATLTTGNFELSFNVILHTVVDNIGEYTIFLVILGGFAFIGVNLPWRIKAVSFLLLTLFLGFFFYSIYRETGIVIRHPDFAEGANWGTRYGTFFVPLASFLVSMLVFAIKFRPVQILCIEAIMLANIIAPVPVTVGEATDNRYGSDAQEQILVGRQFREIYDDGLILMERHASVYLLKELGVELSQVVYEGNQKRWEDALTSPQTNVSWVEWQEGDTVWQRLSKSDSFHRYFELRYTSPSGRYQIYHYR